MCGDIVVEVGEEGGWFLFVGGVVFVKGLGDFGLGGDGFVGEEGGEDVDYDGYDVLFEFLEGVGDWLVVVGVYRVVDGFGCGWGEGCMKLGVEFYVFCLVNGGFE